MRVMNFPKNQGLAGSGCLTSGPRDSVLEPGHAMSPTTTLGLMENFYREDGRQGCWPMLPHPR